MGTIDVKGRTTGRRPLPPRPLPLPPALSAYRMRSSATRGVGKAVDGVRATDARGAGKTGLGPVAGVVGEEEEEEEDKGGRDGSAWGSSRPPSLPLVPLLYRRCSGVKPVSVRGASLLGVRWGGDRRGDDDGMSSAALNWRPRPDIALVGVTDPGRATAVLSAAAGAAEGDPAPPLSGDDMARKGAWVRCNGVGGKSRSWA